MPSDQMGLSWDLVKEKYLRTIKDFPQKGILFYDIFPLFKSPAVVQFMVDELVKCIATSCPGIQVIAGLESRGFLLAPMVSLALDVAFIPIRKAGKLPGETHSVSYEKEYGKDTFEIQKDAIDEGQSVVILDDLIATGGSALAGHDLIRKAGGSVAAFVFICGLHGLNGKEFLRQKTRVPHIHTLLELTDE